MTTSADPIKADRRSIDPTTAEPTASEPTTADSRALATHPRCGFVPPYLLAHVAGDEHHALQAAQHPCGRTLLIDAAFRESREQAASDPARTRRAAAVEQKNRWVIHSAGNQETLPGQTVRSEGDPVSNDVSVDEAYAWTQQVWNLYEQQFDRRSFDGAGSTVTVTVHYGQDYDNAFWDGEQLVFGDGDGEIFERFTKPADVLAHEFTHGVVQYTSAFTYSGQPGALNESVADVFASLSIQYAASQTADQGTWLIGEGLFQPGINAKALRSMLEPGTAYDDPKLGKDPQVASMADYVDTEEDSGGVHINSGIPNRAFALAATTIGGHSWEQAGRVWYEALISDEVGANTTFQQFAQATVDAAGRLFAGSAVPDQVRGAWVTVGVLEASTPVDIAGSPASDSPASDSPASDSHAPDSPAPDPAPDPASAEPAAPNRVAVRRSGGFAGQVRSGEVVLGDDEQGAELRRLLRRVDLQQFSASQPAPDRFVYTLDIGDRSVTIGERDLPPDLQRVVQIVLGAGGPDLSGPGRDLG